MPLEDTIPRIAYGEIRTIQTPSADEFIKLYQRPGRAVVIQGDFDLRKTAGEWSLKTLREKMGGMEFIALKTNQGRLKADGDPFGKVKLGEFAEALEAGKDPGWHLSAPVSQFPASFGRAFAAPPYCASAPLLQSRIWIAPAGTVTPLHWDMPANFISPLFGRRRVVLYPPSQLPLVSPHTPFSRTPNFASFDPEKGDLRRFPLARFAHPVGTILKPGDLLYVPPRWLHHIRSLDNSLVVNYWWGGPILAMAWRAGNAFKSIRGIYQGEWSPNRN